MSSKHVKLEAEPDIDKLRQRFRSLITALRFFAAKAQFGYLDRLASALDPAIVEATIYEIVRALRASLNAAFPVKIKLLGEDREEECLCLDYIAYDSESKLKEDPFYALCKRFEDVAKVGIVNYAPPGSRLRTGTYVICYTLPVKGESVQYPSEDEVSEFLRLVKTRGVEVARILATLAASGSPFKSIRHNPG